MEGSKRFEETHWIANGIGFGVFIFILNGIIIPVIQKHEFTLINVLVVAFSSLVGGLLYGYIIKLYMGWRRKKRGE